MVGDLPERFHRARRDPSLVLLEGFHPVKHALRLGAEVLEAVSPDRGELRRLARELAPDLAAELQRRVREIPAAAFRRLAPAPPPTGVLAIARRPEVDPGALLATPGSSPVVFLERPNHLGNLGAAVRAAAAAGAAGLLASGPNDPWHPEAVRGAAGLQFALPVARIDGLPETDRPLIAIDPAGGPLAPGAIPARAVLAFGSERSGLPGELLERAAGRLAIPMRPGVSSLNLAAAVAVALYAWRWGAAVAGVIPSGPSPDRGGPGTAGAGR